MPSIPHLTLLSTPLYALTGVFSAYNLYLSSITIPKLQKYEEKTEQAAEWSRTAADQLKTTRTTVGGLTGSFLISTLTSSYLVFRNLTSSVSHPYTPAITLVNIAALAAAGIHAGNFWNHKAKIPLPGVGDYNDAITLTERQVMNLRVVVVGWVGSFVLGMFV